MAMLENSQLSAQNAPSAQDEGLEQVLGKVSSLLANLQEEESPDSVAAANLDSHVEPTAEEEPEELAYVPYKSPIAAEAVQEAEHSDDEMSDYLKLLMERVTGKPYEPEGKQPKPASHVAKPQKPVAKAAAEVPDRPVTETVTREPAKAPECKEMMSTFRELAAQSASAALNSNQHRVLLRTAGITVKFGMALSVVSIGVTIASIHLHSSWMHTIGFATLSFAFVALLRAGCCHWALNRAMKPKPAAPKTAAC